LRAIKSGGKVDGTRPNRAGTLGNPMPRKSKAALTIAHIGPGARRLEPPADMAPEAAAVFRETVAIVPCGHFQPENMPLICSYARDVVLTQRAAAELAAQPVVDGKVSPWLAIYTTMLRAQVVLSRLLKIGPKARHPDSRRASKPVREPSYYETHPVARTASPAPREGDDLWKRQW
jgi:hypothetical protein